MFCPKCRCEYRVGFKVCADCNIDLIDKLEESEVTAKLEETVAINPIKIISVSNTIEAEMIMNLLRNNDIQCFGESNFLGGNTKINLGYSVFGEDIFVDGSDYKRAFDLINEMKLEVLDEADYEATEKNGENG